MEAKELRISNWVNSWRISDEWHHTQISCGKELDFIFMQEENNIYKPIPLNEEWLLKFGFTSNPNQNRYELDGFYIDESKYKGLEFWESTTSRMVTTVHQLQNLYFALTGEELKIEPKTL